MLEIPWHEAVTEFHAEKSITLRPKTADSYRTLVRQLAHWAGARELKLRRVREAHVIEYLAHRKQNVSAATLYDDWIAVRVFFQWARRRQYIGELPLPPRNEFRIPKPEAPAVTAPKREEVELILKSIRERWNVDLNPECRYCKESRREFIARRDYAIFAALAETGWRIGEVLALKPHQVERTSTPRLIIPGAQTKNRKPKAAPVSIQWLGVLDQYLRARPKLDSNRLPLDVEELFITERGEQLRQVPMTRQFARYADFAAKRYDRPELSAITPHDFRRFRGTQLAKRDIWVASQVLGVSMEILKRHYLEEDPEHVRAVCESAGMLATVEAQPARRNRPRLV